MDKSHYHLTRAREVLNPLMPHHLCIMQPWCDGRLPLWRGSDNRSTLTCLLSPMSAAPRSSPSVSLSCSSWCGCAPLLLSSWRKAVQQRDTWKAEVERNGDTRVLAMALMLEVQKTTSEKQTDDVYWRGCSNLLQSDFFLGFCLPQLHSNLNVESSLLHSVCKHGTKQML